MRKAGIIILCFITAICLCSCRQNRDNIQIVATTQPVYDFTAIICKGSGVSVTRLVSESVSCLHDYTLQVSQMQAIEQAEIVIMTGAGMETFLDEALLSAKTVIDCSKGIELLCSENEHHHHSHEHSADSHIWLSPSNASIMANNIYQTLCNIYPDKQSVFSKNFADLNERLQQLSDYADEQLKNLSCRDIITFHNGFSYMAHAFGLNIIHTIEEEAGSEASASELIELTSLVSKHNLPAIFTECNGSTSAAQIVSAETGVKVYALDMGMSERTYFDAMKYNIDTLKEALE